MEKLTDKRSQFLEFLLKLFNTGFDTDSFEIRKGILEIYSPQLKAGGLVLVNDPYRKNELSLSALFGKLKEFFSKLKEGQVEPVEKVIIVATTEEDGLIDDFISYLLKNEGLDVYVEFWGWESLKRLFENFKYFIPRDKKVEVDRFVNFVPTANVYQLFGIDEFLAKLDEKIDSSINPVVIHNPLHGTGRTAIALAYAFHYDYQKKFDHFAYVEVLENLKLDFVVAFNGYAGFYYRPDVSVDENIEVLIRLLNDIDGRNLIIFDGVRNVSQASVLLTIAKQLKWKILVTSKFRIYTFENLYLDHPEPKAALEIFRYYAKDFDQDLAGKIIKKVSYHPFAIVFIARAYSYFSKYGGLTDVQLDKMLEERDNRVYHLYDYVDRSLSKNQVLLQRTILKYIMALFDYQVKEFSNLEKRILLVASVLPSKLITLKQLRQFVPYGKEEDFNDAVLTLISKGWLEADKNRFRVPSYIRMVLHKKFKPTPGKLKRYVRLIRERTGQSGVDVLNWIVFAQALIKSVSQVTPEIADIALRVAEVLYTIDIKKDAIDYYQYAVYVYEEMANQIQDENLFELITHIWKKIGDYDRALFYAHQLLDMREQNSQGTVELAKTYYLVAQLYEQLDDLEKALYYADSALDTFTMILGEDDRSLQEIKEYHKYLSEKIKQNKQKPDKGQWFRRLLI